ncbi:hypothetical protein [Nocardioides sp. YIM 152588]|uniref:hypothetical protein n=1 Tax=Nocardioides sp. YIM 152588 TaxID=3158259 RepID=UPI0032E3F5B4
MSPPDVDPGKSLAVNLKATALALALASSSLMGAVAWQSPPAAAESAAETATKQDGVIAWAGAGGGIFVSAHDGRGWTRIVGTHVRAGSLDWSPDGDRLLWVGATHRRVYVADADGSNVEWIAGGDGARHETPAWSPDGERVLWSKDGDLWVVDADGSDAAAVVADAEWNVNATWSPDGRRILWDRPEQACLPDCVDSEPGVFLANADGSDVARLPGSGAGDRYPAWSPTGDLVAWQRSTAGTGDATVVAKPDGTVVRTFDVGDRPRWSPDGESLLVGGHIADLASGEVREFTEETVRDAAWAPSGTKIATVEPTRGSSGRPTVYTTVDAAAERRWLRGPSVGTHLAWRPVDRVYRCRGLLATIVGTPGDDVLTGGVGRDVIVGLGGDDRIAGRSQADVLCGGAGADDILTGTSPTTSGDGSYIDQDVASGGRGDDVVRGGSGQGKLFGGPGDDVLRDSGGFDRLYGGGGDDHLLGGNDTDYLYGGGGKDRLLGGKEFDFLKGGAGRDVLEGGGGSDILYGEAGPDVLRGDGGRDDLYGGDGPDTMYGGDEDDYLYGDGGDDRLYGEDGRDVLHGGDGHDRCGGGAGGDIVYSDCEVRGANGRSNWSG